MFSVMLPLGLIRRGIGLYLVLCGSSQTVRRDGGIQAPVTAE